MPKRTSLKKISREQHFNVGPTVPRLYADALRIAVASDQDIVCITFATTQMAYGEDDDALDAQAVVYLPMSVARRLTEKLQTNLPADTSDDEDELSEDIVPSPALEAKLNG